MTVKFLKKLFAKEKISEDEEFAEMIPKSTLEEFDSINYQFKAKEMITILSPNTWFIRGEFADRTSVCKVYYKPLLSATHLKHYLASELSLLNQLISGSLQNEYLIQIFKVIQSEKNVMIFMENYIKTGIELVMESGAQNEEVCKKISKQILNAINYLHTKGISHRNIKLENIYLTDESPTTKLADLTCALFCTQGSKTLMDSTWVGTQEYMSPEVLKSKAHDPRISDIWSFGVCLFILLHNCYPFGCGDDIRSDVGRDQMHGKQLSRSYLIPNSIKLSSDCLLFYRYLMTPESDERPDANKALNHDWIINS